EDLSALADAPAGRGIQHVDGCPGFVLVAQPRGQADYLLAAAFSEPCAGLVAADEPGEVAVRLAVPGEDHLRDHGHGASVTARRAASCASSAGSLPGRDSGRCGWGGSQPSSSASPRSAPSVPD